VKARLCGSCGIGRVDACICYGKQMRGMVSQQLAMLIWGQMSTKTLQPTARWLCASCANAGFELWHEGMEVEKGKGGS
jgi:hypothetical protein